jgi:hypothetical protein
MIKLLLVILVVVPACEIIHDVTYKPKVGALQPDAAALAEPQLNACGEQTAGDACDDSNPDVAVSYSQQIVPLITRPFGGCMVHAQMIAMVDLRFDSYKTLRRGGANSGTNIIIDCKPCQSIIVQKLEDAMPALGGVRMPMTGQYWSADELRLLRDWIAEGALDN